MQQTIASRAHSTRLTPYKIKKFSIFWEKEKERKKMRE
jgi:hypothetical protein